MAAAKKKMPDTLASVLKLFPRKVKTVEDAVQSARAEEEFLTRKYTEYFHKQQGDTELLLPEYQADFALLAHQMQRLAAVASIEKDWWATESGQEHFTQLHNALVASLEKEAKAIRVKANLTLIRQKHEKQLRRQEAHAELEAIPLRRLPRKTFVFDSVCTDPQSRGIDDTAVARDIGAAVMERVRAKQRREESVLIVGMQ